MICATRRLFGKKKKKDYAQKVDRKTGKKRSIPSQVSQQKKVYKKTKNRNVHVVPLPRREV